MKCIKIIRSGIDNTIKYVFDSNGSILEFSFINKNDGKDIVVVPTQTSCNLGCKFCFLTGLKIPVKNLTSLEIVQGVNYVLNDRSVKNKTLLISFMGCGEPLLTLNEVISSMYVFRELYDSYYNVVRFAVASLIPSISSFYRFTNFIYEDGLRCKFHYSLHTIDSDLRKELMPAAEDFQRNDISNLLRHYRDETHNSIEIHYSLIDGVNDSDEDATRLIKYLGGTYPIPIKFLKLSEKEGEPYRQSKRIAEFRRILESQGIPTEYYEPPGSDVGSSCGQFLSYVSQEDPPAFRQGMNWLLS